MSSSWLRAYLIYGCRKDSWQLSSNPSSALMPLVYPKRVGNSIPRIYAFLSPAIKVGGVNGTSIVAWEDNKEQNVLALLMPEVGVCTRTHT